RASRPSRSEACLFDIRRRDLERSPQAERIGLLAHEADHVGEVLLERQAEKLSARREIFSLDTAGEWLVLHPLLHRARLEIEHALARPNQRRGSDETAQFVTGEERLLQPAVARDAGDLLGVRKDGPNRPFRIALRAQNLAALVRMVAQCRPAL